ncbi:MAG: methionine adenosyltransferase [Rectinemataceae bacterium]|nr:methionine adenosyltransferase [Spirochaetaceae bacterium]
MTARHVPVSVSSLRPFTSESVAEGHPDKICDQISDAVLDACLAKDRHSRVACETFTTTGMVLVAGEITTRTYVDIAEVARGVVRSIGYDNPDYGLDWESMAVITSIHNQSPDIAQGVDGHGIIEGKIGAGDQGMMFGFACRDTPELMPAPIMYAHNLMRKAAEVRKARQIEWMRPDGKCQVTVDYDGFKPVRINTVVFSQQHDDTWRGSHLSHDQIEAELIEKVIRPVLEPTGLLDEKTRYLINPTGRFVIGGPAGDTGLTGRKIIVDTYGGMARHGGGAFSGKDATKVDRSAAYMARYIAKHVVAAGLADRCEIQLAYAIGVPDPVSVNIDTFGTARIDELAIERAVLEVFRLSPYEIIETLKLKEPRYQATASYGHFGRPEFTWERLDRVEELKRAIR